MSSVHTKLNIPVPDPITVTSLQVRKQQSCINESLQSHDSESLFSKLEMTEAHLKWLKLIRNDSSSFEMTRAHSKWLELIRNDSSSFEMTRAHSKWLELIRNDSSSFSAMNETEWLQNNSWLESLKLQRVDQWLIYAFEKLGAFYDCAHTHRLLRTHSGINRCGVHLLLLEKFLRCVRTNERCVCRA